MGICNENSTSSLRLLAVILLLALSAEESSAFSSLVPSLSNGQGSGHTALALGHGRISSVLNYAVEDQNDGEDEDDDDEDDDDDDDDEDQYIDTASLGDWRNFRRSLAILDEDGDKSNDAKTTKSSTKPASVSKENEELLASQNEELHQEYKTGVWAHQVATPEVGGLVLRMPLEMELYRNSKHSIMGRRLKRLLDGETVEMGTWYARAKSLVEDEMQNIAKKADESGQIDATTLSEESAELLTLFLDNQESWQEVCLVLEQDAGNSKTLVLNRPMAFKLTENLGRLVLNGVFSGPKSDMKMGSQKDLMRFMMAFSSECAVYVGGKDDQSGPAIMIHGIEGLPGAVEISPGSKIYRGGIDAAVTGVLEGNYSPLEFRFFVGCHNYDESALDVSVHLGKYQPIACARSVALKQCIALPKPLWHEVLELCGTDMDDLSTLELLKRDDLQFEVVDETEYDEDEDDVSDELSELDNFDDDDEDYLL